MEKKRVERKLKKGDTVIVIAGGNKNKRPNIGKMGKIQTFLGDRAIVEGVNLVTRHQRARNPQETAGKIQKEAPIHVSNIMYYAEKIKRPVKLRYRFLEDGRKVRGYVNPETREFVQIDA